MEAGKPAQRCEELGCPFSEYLAVHS
jgi:hypothetical protein